jgi:predicted deacylase
MIFIAALAVLLVSRPSIAAMPPALQGSYVDGPSLLSDSGVPYVAYETMEQQLSALAARHPNRAQLVHYGKSLEGRNLNALRIQDASVVPVGSAERSAVQISGAIHGNEYLGIEQALAESFLDSTGSFPGLSLFLASGGVIYVIPVINPDGYARRSRGNAKGVDLNRDFDLLPESVAKFTQPETLALKSYLEADLGANHLKLRLTMDYHCCMPALITPWTYKDAQPEQRDLAAFNEIGATQTQLLGYQVGNASDTVGYLAPGSSVDYFYAKYGAYAFTIEGRHRGESKVVERHLKLFDQVFERLALHQLGIIE